MSLGYDVRRFSFRPIRDGISGMQSFYRCLIPNGILLKQIEKVNLIVKINLLKIYHLFFFERLRI